ncbi:hypothetical protein [Pseudomonas phage PlaquesPlease]|uniref:Uncharacterized protein n=1 Tax=Pseudomonas phage PlaquesPlease TaxID=2762289 RepID=A0A7G8LJS6_9CAUD|nr:hypothetical protein [Pseudomonas phage PlaquesPlease]
MEVTIKASSSIVDDRIVLITTSTTIGEFTTEARAGYDKQELMDNRYLSGTFEERVEALRQSAERMTETSVKLHFQALAKIAQPEPKVTEIKGHKADILVADDVEVPAEKPAKKTRAPRKPKATN